MDRVGVIAALERLSPRQRSCIVLRYYEDLSVAEIAPRFLVVDKNGVIVAGQDVLYTATSGPGPTLTVGGGGAGLPWISSTRTP